MICAIAAVDNEWGIGFNNELLESIPQDLKRFKELTTDKIVIMGKKTWDSLPRKPLPNRINIIITRDTKLNSYDNVIFMNLDEAKTFLKHTDKDVFVIGGGFIYKELLPLCTYIYLTKIYKSHQKIDTYFPNLDEFTSWLKIEESDIFNYNDLSYQFLDYKRKN